MISLCSQFVTIFVNTDIFIIGFDVKAPFCLSFWFNANFPWFWVAISFLSSQRDSFSSHYNRIIENGKRLHCQRFKGRCLATSFFKLIRFLCEHFHLNNRELCLFPDFSYFRMQKSAKYNLKTERKKVVREVKK